MAGNDVIKEFLVGLGFKVNESSLKTFSNGIATATQKAVVLAVAVEGAAVAVGAAVTKMAAQMEQLFYAGQRSRSTVLNLQSVAFAAEQVGVSVDNAQGSVLGLARFMRNTPGSARFLQSLGVAAHDANGQLRDTTDILMDLGERFRNMPYYRARVYANALGIDEDTLRGLMNGMGQFAAQYHAMYRTAGIDAEEAAKHSRVFMNELRVLGASFSLLWQKVSHGLIKVLTPFVKQYREQIMDNFGRIAGQLERVLGVIVRVAGFMGALAIRIVGWFSALDRATDGWSTAIGAALVAWKALNLGFMLSPIGAIITAVLALGTAIVALVDDFQTWKEGGASLIDWSQWAPGIEAALEGIRSFIELVTGGLGAAVDAVGGMLSGVLPVVAGNLLDAGERLLAGFGRVIDMLVMLFRSDLGGVITEVASLLGSQFLDTAAMLLVNLSAIIQAIVQLLTGDFAGAWDTVLGIIERVWSYIETTLGRVLDAVSVVTGALSRLTGAGDAIQAAKNKAADVVTSVAGSAPVKAATGVLQSVGSWFGFGDKQENPAAIPNTALAPSPAAADQLMTNNEHSANINQTTEIIIQGGSDPSATAQAVFQGQGQVNGDLIRNMKGAIQ